MRVRADLLDNLVNYAGEVSIYRARLEQQVGAIRFNLTELDQTVARLREQLRTMDIETEAQILYRFDREYEGVEDAARGLRPAGAGPLLAHAGALPRGVRVGQRPGQYPGAAR